MTEDEVPVCPYCKKQAKLITGSELYPTFYKLRDKQFWRCAPCDAHVGCHGSGWNPLGRLANPQLRKMKMNTHAAFDPIWKDHRPSWDRKRLSRRKAYAWLAEQLGIPTDQCHIGMFDEDRCWEAIRAANEYRKSK